MEDKKILIGSEDDNELHVKNVQDIVYMESVGRKTKTYCKEGKEYVLKNSLSHMEESLPDEKFFKIHRSFIINVDYLKGINIKTEKMVLLHNGIKLRISHRKYKDFMEFVKNKFDFW